MAAGHLHSLALTEAGRAYSWGYGNLGRLGQGDEENQYTPKLIEPLQAVRVVGVVAGVLHNLAFTEAGRVYSWGGGGCGKLSLGGGWGARARCWRVREPAPWAQDL